MAEAAFATTIVASGANFGNAADPSVPAEFAGVIAAVQGLDNMHAVMPAVSIAACPWRARRSPTLRRLRWPMLLIPEPMTRARFHPE